MAEIEQRAHAAFALVERDNLRLVATGVLDGVRKGFGLTRDNALQVRLEPFKEVQVPDQAVFDDFGESGRKLPIRERREGVRISDDHEWLVERADHVLAEGMVDRGFAADCGIDLRKQRGRHLDERNAALINGCGKTGYVADYAAAERDQRRVALATMREQRIDYRVEGFPALVLFPLRHDDRHRAHTLRCEARRQLLEVKGCDRRIGDDRGTLLGEARRKQSGLCQQASSDVYRIAAFPELNVQGAHDLSASTAAPRARAQLSEFLLQAMRQIAQALVAGVDHDVGDLPIKRVALGKELGQLRERIGGLQERTIAVMPRALPQILCRGAQINDDSVLRQHAPVVLG